MTVDRIKFQLPGFWISPRSNKLQSIITTSDANGNHVQERLVLDNLDLNKWTNITLVLNRRSVALYRNGLLERTISLVNSVHINNDNLYATYFCGFPGYMAYLQFFNRALEPNQVLEIYQSNLKKINKYASKNLKATKDEDDEDQEEISDYIPDESTLFGDFGMISQDAKSELKL